MSCRAFGAQKIFSVVSKNVRSTFFDTTEEKLGLREYASPGRLQYGDAVDPVTPYLLPFFKLQSPNDRLLTLL